MRSYMAKVTAIQLRTYQGAREGMEAHRNNNVAPCRVQQTTTDQPCRHRTRNAVNTRHHRHMHPPRRTTNRRAHGARARGGSATSS